MSNASNTSADIVRKIFTTPSAPQKLQDALKKAEAAIAQLNDDVDQEAAAILRARYEELKERHKSLQEVQASAGSGAATEETNKGTPAPLEVEIFNLPDGRIKCVLYLVPGDHSKGNQSIILDAPLMDEEHRIEQTLKVAQELISLAMATIADYTDSLEDHQIVYLSDSYDRLVNEEKRIRDMISPDNSDKHSSQEALEISVQLYFSDVLRFFRAVFLVIRSKQAKA